MLHELSDNESKLEMDMSMPSKCFILRIAKTLKMPKIQPSIVSQPLLPSKMENPSGSWSITSLCFIKRRSSSLGELVGLRELLVSRWVKS